MAKSIYIASSWRHQHGVEMLTALLREQGFEVYSWIENNYEEGYTASGIFDFNEWMKTESADKAFDYDTKGAANCDLFIYYGNGGKDAMAECGICYHRKMNGDEVQMLAIYQKGEDLGLMSKMFDKWVDRAIEAVYYANNVLLDPVTQ